VRISPYRKLPVVKFFCRMRVDSTTVVPGRALEMGMGDGRNIIFLAQRGWDVTGSDLAEVSVAKAKKRAGDVGVKINALVQDADKFDFGTTNAARSWGGNRGGSQTAP
jgi:2-polyprenyl-3-methyl-5-hydroxy-6-metoxy-1,4-benzoquinol methylase